MKLPKAVKLPSGNWRVQISVDGRRRSITAATKKEAERQALLVCSGQKMDEIEKMTLTKAINVYIDEKTPLRSPSTIRGYRQIQQFYLQSLMPMQIEKITQSVFQRAINSDLEKFSVKTVKNAAALIKTVLAKNGRAVTYELPQLVQPEKRFLQEDEIPRFLDAIYGTKNELALLLALHGLRASEIMNTKPERISGGIIKVRGAAVNDADGNLVHKAENKNTTSRRNVPVLIDRVSELAAQMPPGEYIVCGQSNSVLRNACHRACKKAGIDPLSTHDLRRTFASLCYNAGISEEVCMALGGWSDAATMRRVYVQVSQRAMVDSVATLKNSFKIAHETAHDSRKRA